MNRLAKLWWIAKGVGWDNVPRRLLQAWRVRSGGLRRLLHPAGFTDEAFRRECRATLADQPALWARKARSFFPVPSPESLAAVADEATWNTHVLDVCGKALDGEYPFFSHWYGRLGWPPNFNLDPVHDIAWPVGEHWLDTAHSGPPRHDIKLVWEPSRFSMAYTFARAYARSRDDRWAQAFWQMFDAWIRQNPPQLTVAWGCGQEISFRLMAMLFAAIVTLDSPAATNDRLYGLARLAWQSGRQIQANLNYARSQKNNHALSEAAGLWTIGLMFPEFPAAARWRARGRDVLAAETRRQIYDDGSYVQHSMNYHRVMLDVLLWSIRLGQLHDAPLPKIVSDRFALASDWLAGMLDPDSGQTPNYGANDGANVLPLSCCDYTDYRPTVQAAQYAANGRCPIGPGAWNEKTLWLGGSEAIRTPSVARRPPSQWSAPDGGYHVLRGPNSWAMTRCHAYRDRPCQADMLHVDLWYRGVNVLPDAGSYMYYCDEPDKSYFNSTPAHNTVCVDGCDQMVKGPRFLWFRWTRSRVLHCQTSPDGRVGYFEGEHYGYCRLPGSIVHRRAVCRIDDVYIIRDTLVGTGEHTVSLRWRLAPGPWQKGNATSWQGRVGDTPFLLAGRFPQGMSASLIGPDGDPEGVQARASLYYGTMTVSPTVAALGTIPMPATILSVAGPQAGIAEALADVLPMNLSAAVALAARQAIEQARELI